MAPVSDERLSTKDLLDELKNAIRLNPDADIQHPKAKSAVVSGQNSDICNNYRTDIKSSKGHTLSTSCIGNKLNHGSGFQLSCLINGCSSQPFHDTDLFGRITIETYNRYVEK